MLSVYYSEHVFINVTILAAAKCVKHSMARVAVVFLELHLRDGIGMLVSHPIFDNAKKPWTPGDVFLADKDQT